MLSKLFRVSFRSSRSEETFTFSELRSLTTSTVSLLIAELLASSLARVSFPVLWIRLAVTSTLLAVSRASLAVVSTSLVAFRAKVAVFEAVATAQTPEAPLNATATTAATSGIVHTVLVPRAQKGLNTHRIMVQRC
eukprot:Amastigsp_a2_9252.p2 type:complete len:136 gc:universal Amastigsp_a2_9252:413-820(+)